MYIQTLPPLLTVLNRAKGLASPIDLNSKWAIWELSCIGSLYDWNYISIWFSPNSKQ